MGTEKGCGRKMQNVREGQGYMEHTVLPLSSVPRQAKKTDAEYTGFGTWYRVGKRSRIWIPTEQEAAYREGMMLRAANRFQPPCAVGDNRTGWVRGLLARVGANFIWRR
jgi:hypothetical protein